jgi:amidase
MDDVTTLAQALRDGSVTSVELVEASLALIDADSARLGAFLTVTGEQALEAAATVDATDPAERAPFAGIPIAIKDLTATAGVRTTMGSALLADHVPEHDAHVVRLVREAGFISVGKTNTPEFGLSSYTDNDLIGPARTPADPRRNAGGSSGGAAVAVATGMVPVALGSDGGGSIRIPASCCGVVGFKPSRGRVSAGPDSPAWNGLASDGALTQSVRDAALMLDVLSGPQPGDSHIWPKPEVTFVEALTRDPGHLRIATWTDPYLDFVEASPASIAAVAAARERLAALGHEIVEIANPWPAELEPAFNVVWSAGIAAAPIPPEALAMLRPNTRYWIERGSRATAPELAGALSFLELTTGAVNASLTQFDLFLTPTLALPPQPVEWFNESGDPVEDHRRELLFTPYTALMNMSGQPAISLPLYQHEGLPAGVMLAGPVGADARVLQASAQLTS